MTNNATHTPIDGGSHYAMSFNSQHTNSHPHHVQGIPLPAPPGYVPAVNQGQQQMQHHHQQPLQNGAPMQSPYKSFNDSQQFNNSMQTTASNTTYEKPTIYTAVYSGVQVYEMEVNGVACMRRRSDGWLNATQILKVAGIEKGKRTKVLEKEVLIGEHEKVQGGYGKYQGTWINYTRGRQFCRQYGVEEPLLPLLEHDLNGDGSGTGGQNTETPTKEQAMAANRKKFYNSGLDSRNTGQSSQSTFFQNISPMSSIALAAMNKAARYNSPVRPSSNLKRPSLQPSHSQQTIHSENSFHDTPGDSTYLTQNGHASRRQGQEPPRKRMRQSEDAPGAVDASVSLGANDPGDSFLYGAEAYLDGQVERDELATDQPLPAPSTPEEEEKKLLLLDLFADTSRVDYTAHPAFTQLSPHDLSIPLDASANTALHWATTLSRITLLRMLIQKGANIYRGNVAGHSALISAVLVNNCWERSSFPEVLDVLSPLIETRDAQGRTILHHIAVSCGIKGRSPSSKYYLEALLEFLVRSVRPQSSRENGDAQDRPKPATLMSFLTNIVNAKDKLGNTALNLVARIGNRSIIQQLLEIKADPNIANYKGVSARDFGVGLEDDELGMSQPRPRLPNGTPAGATTFGNPGNIDPAISQSPPNAVGEEINQQQQETAAAQAAITEDQNQDVITSLTTMLTQNFAQHKQLLSEKSAQIDRLNTEMQNLSDLQKQEADALATLQRRAKQRSDRIVKVANLRRLVEERRRAHLQQNQGQGRQQLAAPKLVVGEAETKISSISAVVEVLRQLSTSDDDNTTTTLDLENLLSSASLASISALESAYNRNNTTLSAISSTLQKRSSRLEESYRKVVSLATGVPEDKVEESLPLLVAAVESERGGLGFGREEAGRVREFLVKVEGVGAEGVGGVGVGGGNGGHAMQGLGNGGLGLDLDSTPRGHMQLQRQHQQQQQRYGQMGPPELPV